MEIDKQMSMHKETAWKIKLDKNVLLVLNAIEDSSFPEPNVSVILSEGERKVTFTMTKDKFLNLTGVLDSFSQVCLGVEPVLAQEDYAVREPKAAEKKADVVEPAPAPKPKQAPAPVEAALAPKPKAERVEAPAKKNEEPQAAPPAPAKQPVPAPASATTAESRMMAKLDGGKPTAPPKVAFPPRFPAATSDDDEEPEPITMKAAEPEEDLSQLDLGIPAPAPPAPVKSTLAPPAKPTPPSTTMPKITKENAPASTPAPKKPAEAPEASEGDTAPEWDPW